jgi:hypothetical protein
MLLSHPWAERISIPSTKHGPADVQPPIDYDCNAIERCHSLSFPSTEVFLCICSEAPVVRTIKWLSQRARNSSFEAAQGALTKRQLSSVCGR